MKFAALIGKNVANRAAQQLAAYAELIRALHAAPAPRVLVVLSAGIAVGPEAGTATDLDAVSLAAAKSGVTFYALTEPGNLAEGTDTNADRAAARRIEDAALAAGVQTVATAAGGDAFIVVGQADRFFNRIVSESSGVYRLAVEAPVPAPAREFVNVKVSVNRPAVTVRTNAHALASAATPAPMSIDDTLKLRLAQGGAAFGVPIAMATTLRRDPASASQLELAVNVEIPVAAPGPLITMFAIVDDTGHTVKSGRQDAPAPAAGDDYRFTFPQSLAPGHYQLRFAVADARGNIGSVEQSVRAQLAHFGSFAMSEPLLTWTGRDGAAQLLALETLPRSASSLRVAVEIYPDAATGSAPDLAVRLALCPAGDDQPMAERDVLVTRNGTLLSATAELPVTLLEPGTYVIRATLLDSGSTVGSVSTRVTKVDRAKRPHDDPRY
jgi:hypothetical protein